jgi:hypothetical protein
VLDGENLGGSVMVVINGEDARHQAGLETCLAPTDVVSIFPIMAGGVMLEAVSNQRSAFSTNRTTHKGSERRKPVVNSPFCVAPVG